MGSRSPKRLRWLRRALITLALIQVVPLLGACASLMYVHALWEAGNDRCGRVVAQHGGWGIGFNGETDAFVCTGHDAKMRVTAREEIPVEEVMGSSGGWPFVPALVGLALEAVDEDAPQLAC